MFDIWHNGVRTRFYSWATKEAALTAAARIGEARVGLIIPHEEESPDFDPFTDHWCILKENGRPFSMADYREALDLYKAWKS